MNLNVFNQASAIKAEPAILGCIPSGHQYEAGAFSKALSHAICFPLGNDVNGVDLGYHRRTDGLQLLWQCDLPGHWYVRDRSVAA